MLSAMKKLRLIVCLVCLGWTSAAFAQRFNLEHAAKIVNVSNPRMSPDGKSIVVALSRANLKDNRYDTELVLVDVASKAQKILTRRQASLHQWSPDGTRLAFIAPADGKPQLWVLPIDGGEALQVSKSPTGVEQYAWRRDGNAFVYSATEERPAREGEDKANRSFEADVNYLLTEAPVSSHLWIVPAAGGESTRLTSGQWSVAGGLWWAPDGKTIVFDSQPGPGPRYWEQQSSRIVDVETRSRVVALGKVEPRILERLLSRRAAFRLHVGARRRRTFHARDLGDAGGWRTSA